MPLLHESSEDFTEVLGVELAELAGVIRLALADAEDPQLFGCGSRIAPVRAAVAASGRVPRFELPAFAANAIGGCLVGIASQTKTTIKDIRGAINNKFIDSEGNRMERCRRSRNCTDFAVIRQPVCDVLSFVASEAELPRGVCSNGMAQCHLTNISHFDRENEITFLGTIFAQSGFPVIEAVNATRFESLNVFFQQSITFHPSFFRSNILNFISIHLM
jgi:hypothetical protein